MDLFIVLNVEKIREIIIYIYSPLLVNYSTHPNGDTLSQLLY